MSEATVYTVEKQKDGTTITYPYVPPAMPTRQYRIEHKTTGQWVLETPGNKADPNNKPEGAPPKYSLLSADQKHHATRYTDEEAVEKARAWKLSKEFAIHSR